MTSSSISIIAPIYNSGSHIIETLKELEEVMLRADINFELILIDDGSTDDTPQHLRYFSSTSQVSKLKVNEVNSGMGHCILEGVKIAK